MELDTLHEHLDKRLDRIEGKLDSHLERITKAEADVSTIRGQMKLGLTGIMTLLSAAITYLLNHFGGLR